MKESKTIKSPRNGLDAIIFDLDGLLSDTETLHMEAYITTLRKFSITLTPAEYAEHWIKRGFGIVRYLNDRHIKLDPDAVRRIKARTYASLLDSSLREMPGAGMLLDFVSGKYKLGLATSSHGADASKVLANLGFDKYFDAIVTCDDVDLPKPAPDLFEKTASLLSVDPGRCLVVEDAEKGILAAHRANMKSAAVPNEHTAGNDFSLATYVFGSLDELRIFLDKREARPEPECARHGCGTRRIRGA